MTSSEKTCEALQTSISQQLQRKSDTDNWCVCFTVPPPGVTVKFCKHRLSQKTSQSQPCVQQASNRHSANSRSWMCPLHDHHTKMSCTLEVCGSFDWLLFTEGVCPTGWCQIRELQLALHKTSASTQSTSLQWLTPTRPSTTASHYPAWSHLKDLWFNKNWPENGKREKGRWKATAPLKKRILMSFHLSDSNGLFLKADLLCVVKTAVGQAESTVKKIFCGIWRTPGRRSGDREAVCRDIPNKTEHLNAFTFGR